MRITQNIQQIKSNQVLDVSVDVHKDILNFFFSLNGKEYRDECPNRTKTSKSAYRIITALPGNKA